MCKVYSVINHDNKQDSQECILIRGLPGSGKTTKSKEMVKNDEADILIEADQYFEDDEGNYNFNGENIMEAHQDCRFRAFNALSNGKTVIISNTFVYRWQMEVYIDYCNENKINIKVICLFNSGFTPEQLCNERCIHNVPFDRIKLWYDTYEHDWENADPRQPWKR